MRVRILSEFAGSGRCGSVVDLPESIALPRLRSGDAERVAETQTETPAFPPNLVFNNDQQIEAHIVDAPVETAVQPVAKGRKRR